MSSAAKLVDEYLLLSNVTVELLLRESSRGDRERGLLARLGAGERVRERKCLCGGVRSLSRERPRIGDRGDRENLDLCAGDRERDLSRDKYFDLELIGDNLSRDRARCGDLSRDLR